MRMLIKEDAGRYGKASLAGKSFDSVVKVGFHLALARINLSFLFFFVFFNFELVFNFRVNLIRY